MSGGRRHSAADGDQADDVVPSSRPLNLGYRPSTYWPETTGTRAFLGRIKGTVRRRIAKNGITGGLSEVPDEVFEPSLTEEDRQEWGMIHPALMGGEYLPELGTDEVEIARLELDSTTGDVISIRALRDADAIHYRIVDENDDGYEFSPDRSERPLTLAELVALLDHACVPGQNQTRETYGLVQGFWEWNFDTRSGPEKAVNFVTVSSPFYPALAEYYRARADEWIAARRTT